MADPQQQPMAPVMMPFYQPPQHEMRVLDSQCVPNVSPVRVNAAFEFVAYMGYRMKPVVAIDSMGNIQSERQEPLTGAEKGAFDAACAVLTDYFNGALDMDVLEQQRATGGAFELAKRCPGTPQPCPECHGRRENGIGAPCQVCATTGKVLVVPIDDDKAVEQPKQRVRRRKT